ncbi:hypothetical protein Acr_00g0074330 [Actinidia rufa]|uniref:Reverse transcriptase RNase H-like domain-containing protein n=1 Tax=Actinidia rufa TaxID=165716 RepID=A0A7J0DUQ5_9ERIC|nr:hypothetical protein Acr_00g0074330 [Actinidia rufa]
MGKELILYLSVLPTAVSVVLMKEEDKVQKPMYYVSKVLMGAKTRYLKIEKIALRYHDHIQRDYLTEYLRMLSYLDEVKAMKIKDFKICQIPQEENKQADVLPNLAFAFDFISDKSVLFEFLPNPSIDVAKIFFQATTDPTWMDGIIAYLKYEEFIKGTFGPIWNEMLWRSPKSATSVKDLLRYEIESVIPVEIRMPNFMMMNFDKENNEVELRLNLDLLVKRRERAEVGIDLEVLDVEVRIEKPDLLFAQVESLAEGLLSLQLGHLIFVPLQGGIMFLFHSPQLLGGVLPPCLNHLENGHLGRITSGKAGLTLISHNVSCVAYWFLLSIVLATRHHFSGVKDEALEERLLSEGCP